MSLNREDPQKDLQQSEVDLDTLLTSFLDKEIGVPSEINELAPDLDLKLKETLWEIGLLNAPPAPSMASGEDRFPASSGEHTPPVPPRTEAAVREEQALQADLTLPQESSMEQSSVAAAGDSVSYLADAIQVVLEPQKTPDSKRTRALAAGAIGVLVLLGIAGYFWYRPGRAVKPVGPIPIAESTPFSAETPKVSPLAPPGQKTSQLGSPENPTGKAESAVPSGATAKAELPQPRNTPTTLQEEASHALTPPLEAPSTAYPTNRLTNNQTVPSHSAPPTSPLDLKSPVPELPPSEGNATIAIKDLVLPKPSVNSAVQPQIAFPTAAPGEPTNAGVATPAVALTKIRVIYPEIAKRTGVKGRVDVEFSVDTKGRVVQANAKSGPLVLRKAAEDAVYRARFKPATSNGVNILAKGKITLVFDPDSQ
jgi:TonB family protein